MQRCDFCFHEIDNRTSVVLKPVDPWLITERPVMPLLRRLRATQMATPYVEKRGVDRGDGEGIQRWGRVKTDNKKRGTKKKTPC